jgi:hypothetical protein
VLSCYLDDSGKDPQNIVTTIAGYIARDEQWAEFEQAVQPIFARYGVRILHSKELHATDGDFEGWTVLRKQAFVARLCMERSSRLMLGLSMSALKSSYKERAATSDRKRTITAYTFCFNVIVDWIMRDIRIGGIAHKEGVALILERGHENNSEAEQQFYEIRKLHKIEDVLRSISFVPKDACRAIQMADLLAFYTRRDSVAMQKAVSKGEEAYRVDTMLRIITENLPHRGFVATDFGGADQEPGLPSWRPPS